jgi:hypothetical protein
MKRDAIMAVASIAIMAVASIAIMAVASIVWLILLFTRGLPLPVPGFGPPLF